MILGELHVTKKKGESENDVDANDLVFFFLLFLFVTWII